MMKPLRFLVVSVVLLSLGTVLLAEQLTTVAVVDTAKVYTAFFIESSAVRELERNKKAMQDDINKYQNDLKKLQADRLAAQMAKNNQEILRLDQEIYNQQQLLSDFRRVKQQQLNDQQKTLMQSDTFLGEIAAAIKYIAESDGYTLVVDSSTPGLRFWSADVDITNKVLDYLRHNVAR